VKLASFVLVDKGDRVTVSVHPAAADPYRDPHAEERVRYDFDSPRHVLQLRCVRCGRTERRPLTVWASLVVRLDAQGLSVLDVSTLAGSRLLASD